MNDWLATLHDRLVSEPVLVRVMIATVRGSAPREPGACMLVGETTEDGTIGGGHLELKAIEIARQMLQASGDMLPRLDRFTLGATLGQCCGGVVELWFERFTADDMDFVTRAMRVRKDCKPVVMAILLNDTNKPERALFTSAGIVHGSIGKAAAAVQSLSLWTADAPRAAVVSVAESSQRLFVERIDAEETPLWLFGAGHVGKALVKTLADLPFRVTWIDNRDAMFPTTLPNNVTPLASDFPADEVPAAPQGACFLVLTHSHDLDYEICRAILRRDDFVFAGLIGSRSKATRFSQRLARQGVSPEHIAKLTCPIGVNGIASKRPAAIAVSVAVQLLQTIEGRQMNSNQPAALGRLFHPEA